MAAFTVKWAQAKQNKKKTYNKQNQTRKKAIEILKINNGRVRYPYSMRLTHSMRIYTILFTKRKYYRA